MQPSALNVLLDRTVLPGMLGFTRLGYAMRRTRWQPLDADLTGRRMLITGATSGLGEAAARALLSLGASLVLVGRDREKLGRTRSALAAMTARPESRMQLEVADLGQLTEVRALAARLLAGTQPLHVLVNNAGALYAERELTAEGLERSLALNLLAPFLLSRLLLPRLEESAPARIVNVSSGGMYTQRIDVDDLQSRHGQYSGSRAYAKAKRGMVILTELLAERVAGCGVVVNSMHPGWADTPGVETSLPAFYRIVGPVLRTAEQGADTIVWLAAAAEAAQHTGGFWFDREPHLTHVLPGTRESRLERSALWAQASELVGLPE